MNQLKPYLFWIISGVILLILLILGLFVLSPTDESIDGTPRDAYEVKSLLDTDAKKLQELSKRAKRGDPNRVFDPQVKGDIDTLTNDYLLTKDWKGVIDPHVEKYDQQLKALRQDLIDRSAVLRKEITSDHGKLQWYTTYEAVTADLVTRLRTARALLVAETGTATSTFVPSAGGGPAAGVGAVGDDPLHPQKGSRIRSVLGLLTTTSYPEPTEHDLLTRRFRIVEAVATAVLASEAEALPNPLVGAAVPPRSPAAITSWDWKTDTAETLEGGISTYATPVRCTVGLQGSESSLGAALARLESLERPVVIVLGVTFARIDRAPSGARKPLHANGDAVIAPATVTVELLVLDFGQMPDLTSVAAPSASGAPPGMHGPGGPIPNGSGMGTPAMPSGSSDETMNPGRSGADVTE